MYKILKERQGNKSYDGSIKAMILDEKVRYNSLDQAREQIRDFINKNRLCIKDAK